MGFNPTNQQLAVINHVQGHARVLAIAGSGKTTTMVYRIKNLIENHNVPPKSIRVLMFNNSASTDFKNKLKEKTSLKKFPYISTFHSFGYRFIQNAVEDGYLNKAQYWILENEYKADMLLSNIIRDFEAKEIIKKDKVELDEIKMAISLWKGSLISPEKAGHRSGEDFVKVYKEFERRKAKENALIFDDFIPLTIKILEGNKNYMKKWSNKHDHIIVDEYQDVNYGQQRLIEILAGNKANVMVVGDDDQTIYEWRGARPNYILKEFATTFTTKSHTIYRLDTTFRFGPLLAQCAQNSISLNSSRQVKNVLANEVDQETDIEIIKADDGNIVDTNDELTKIIIRLIKDQKVKPIDVRVIGRLYSQFTGLESCFIAKKVPYEIEGNIPFLKRREVAILLDYGLLIEKMESNMDKEVVDALLNILNTPNRKIKKKTLEIFLSKNRRRPLEDVLIEYVDVDEKMNSLLDFLIDGFVYLKESLEKNEYRADEFFQWIYKHSKLKNHYLNYFGEGEEATNKINTTEGFILFCHDKTMKPSELREHIRDLDTTRGAEKDQRIILSTVYKTKGLEFDYVFIPDCIENNMPYISNNEVDVFDITQPSLVTELSESLESERRLFYVAITRAIKKVYIGTGSSGNSQNSRFLEEILFEKTRDVLFPVVFSQELGESWLDKVKLILGFKRIVDNLKVYLNRKGEDQMRRIVDDLSVEVPEQEFRYQFAYDSKRKELERDIDTDEPGPWDDVTSG